jgi:hypothetical protein
MDEDKFTYKIIAINTAHKAARKNFLRYNNYISYNRRVIEPLCPRYGILIYLPKEIKDYINWHEARQELKYKLHENIAEAYNNIIKLEKDKKKLICKKALSSKLPYDVIRYLYENFST